MWIQYLGCLGDYSLPDEDLKTVLFSAKNMTKLGNPCPNMADVSESLFIKVMRALPGQFKPCVNPDLECEIKRLLGILDIDCLNGDGSINVEIMQKAIDALDIPNLENTEEVSEVQNTEIPENNIQSDSNNKTGKKGNKGKKK